MSKPKDEPIRLQPRDVVKMPATLDDFKEIVKNDLIDVSLKQGYTPEEAEENYREVMKAMSDPETMKAFVQLREMAAQYGEGALQRAIQADAARRSELAKANHGLKVWTGTEDERRSKAHEGKDATGRQ